MTDTKPERNLIRRRIIYVVVTAVLLLGGGTLGWYYLANQISKQVNNQVQIMAEQGKFVECKNQSVQGYPFRVGLFCDTTSFSDKKEGIYIKTGALRSAAQFYQPGFVISELDGPANLQISGLAPLKLKWQLARSSLRVSLSGIKRLSLKLINFAVNEASENGQALVDLSKLQIHTRPAAANLSSADLDLALDAEGLRLGDILSGNGLPLDLKFDVTVSELNKLLKTGQDIRRWIEKNGVDLAVRNFEIGGIDSGSVVASGVLRVDNEGLISGKLHLVVSELEKIAAEVTRQMPQLGENAKTIQTVSSVLSKSSGDGKMRFGIQINRGNVTMGFIPLGFIPPLF